MNKIKKICSLCLVSVVHLVLVAAFYRRSQGWTLLFRKTWAARPFSHRNSNPLLYFSLQRKEGYSIGPLFRWTWKNLQTYRSNWNDFCFTPGAFNFPTQLVTIHQATTQLEINISDRSCVTNATCQPGAQSKIFR